MKECFAEKDFRDTTLVLVYEANEIIAEYAAQGFTLTLRQLYYQFVARDLIPNTQRSYKRLGSVVNDARLAGLIDWAAIEDRTRHIESTPHWESPADIVRTCARQFRIDKWAKQPYRAEVWIEKEALAGVVSGVCEKLDVPYLSCRGYTSQSVMYEAAARLSDYSVAGQTPVILHFGDHDPSGIDMTRDIMDRLEIFGARVELHRLALNMDQVETHRPPPNPAKVTDSRFKAYLAKYGGESWELDAMEPRMLVGLISDFIEDLRDDDAWAEAVQEERKARAQLRAVAKTMKGA